MFLKYIVGLVFILLPLSVIAGDGAYLKFYNYSNDKIHVYDGWLNGIKGSGSKKDGKFDFHIKAGHSYTKDKETYVEAKTSSSHDFKVIIRPTLKGSKKNKITFKKPVLKSHFEIKKREYHHNLDIYTHIKKGHQDDIFVYMTPHTYRDYYPDWMSKNSNIQNSTLKEITIPGAHDAGMGKANHCSTYANSDTTKTQNSSFYTMLTKGVRYFDNRPIIIKGHKKMYLGHYSWVGIDIDGLGTLRYEGCVGYTVQEMLNDVKKFITKTNGKHVIGKHEVIILNFSHFMNLKDHDIDNGTYFDNKNFKKLTKAIEDTLGDYLVKDNTDFLNTKIKTLTKHGPKVIVVLDNKKHSNNKDGVYKKSHLHLYDHYYGKPDFDGMQHNQFKKMTKKHLKKYFLLSWTLTQDIVQQIKNTIGGGDTIEDLAQIANRNTNLAKILGYSIKHKKYPNIIYADFINSYYAKFAIDINNLRFKNK